MKRQRERARVWPAPIVLGVVTAFGLIAALLSDAAGDVLAWFALAAPVCIVLWFGARRSGRKIGGDGVEINHDPS